MEHIRAEGFSVSVWKCPYCGETVSLWGYWRDGHSQAACDPLTPKQREQLAEMTVEGEDE